MTQPNITPLSWLMVAALGITWGGTFMVIEFALNGITPFWLAAGRIAFAAILTTVVWGWFGFRFFLTEERDWWGTLVVGILSTALPFQLISWGQQYVTSGFAGVSMASVALLVLPLSHFFVPGEAMTLRRTLGFIIGFFGVVLLIGPKAFNGTRSPMEIWGQLACFGAAACYAVSSVVMRRLPPVDPIGLSAIPLIIGAGFVIGTAVVIEGAPPSVSSQTIWIIIFLGLFPTAGANLLRVLVIRTAGPVFMSLTNYQVPLWSVVFGITFLNEDFQATFFIALVLILAGVALSQYGALKRLFGR